MLSSILRFNKSIIRKVKAPLSDIILILTIDIKGSKIQKTMKLQPKEDKEPAKYPIIVFSLSLGNFFFPKRIPKRDAAPSPKVEINAVAEKILIGKKKIGTKDKTKATGLVNSYISLGFNVFARTFEIELGIK